jgi:ABC-type transporter Mla subunit MlaD
MSYDAVDLAYDATRLVDQRGYGIEENSEGFSAVRNGAAVAEARDDFNGAVMDALEDMVARLQAAEDALAERQAALRSFVETADALLARQLPSADSTHDRRLRELANSHR